MTKIAIDIVLLPAEKMAMKLIEINKELLKTNKNKIVLGTKVNPPHISLSMGAVHENELQHIIRSIEELSKNFTPFNFQGKLHVQAGPGDEKFLWLKILKKKKIQNLHESLMKKIWEYLSYDIENYMLADSDEVEEETLSFIKSYSNLYNNPELFNPHVTVGIGDTVKNDQIINFQSSEIALFRLGNYCTCRELLYQTCLKEL